MNSISLTSFLRYCKDIATCYFGALGMHDYSHQKIIVLICCKLSSLFACKRLTSSLTYFLRYCNKKNMLFCVSWKCLTMQTQCDTINLQKIISIFIWMLKLTLSSTSFLRCYIFKNPVISSAGSILVHTLRTRILRYMGKISIAILVLTLDYFKDGQN